MYPARTRYRRLAVASGHSVLRVIPEQGRTHQIRRHLAAIGHPVLGDGTYGGIRVAVTTPRPFLHASLLRFVHPVSGERLSFTSALPADLAEVQSTLGAPAPSAPT